MCEVADHPFEAGVNLGDATFAVLGTGAEFTAVCELADGLTLEAGDTDEDKAEAIERARKPKAARP